MLGTFNTGKMNSRSGTSIYMYVYWFSIPTLYLSIKEGGDENEGWEGESPIPELGDMCGNITPATRAGTVMVSMVSPEEQTFLGFRERVIYYLLL